MASIYFGLFFLFCSERLELTFSEEDSQHIKSNMAIKTVSLEGFLLDCMLDTCRISIVKDQLLKENQILYGANKHLILIINNANNIQKLGRALKNHDFQSAKARPYTSPMNEKIFSSPNWKFVCKPKTCTIILDLTSVNESK